MHFFPMIATFLLAQSSSFRSPLPSFEASLKGPLRLRIQVKAREGFVFNLQAPNRLKIGVQEILPLAADSNTRILKFETPRKKDYQFELYLCDEKKTFCERQEIATRWNGKSMDVKLSTEHSPQSMHMPNITKVRALGEGFILNDAERALDLARSQNKLLLIDFFGIWCPPCNDLDETVFPTREFKNATADFVKLKLDADDPVSWALKSKYKVGGYPTVILSDPKGDELHRIVGFLQPMDFIAEIQRAKLLGAGGSKDLEKRAENGDRAAKDLLGLAALTRQDFEKAFALLKGTLAENQSFLRAEIGMLKGKPEQRLKLEAHCFQADNLSSERLESCLDLQGIATESESKNLALKLAAVIRPYLNATPPKGYTLGDLHAILADLLESAGDQKGARASWKMAAKSFGQSVDSLRNRGMNLQLAYAYEKSGEPNKAAIIYKELSKIYPGEFTFDYYHARMLLGNKRAEKALPLSKNAYKSSYGDNRLRTGLLVGEIYQALGQKTKARKFLDQLLSEVKLPEDTTIRTHRYVKNLRDLRAKL